MEARWSRARNLLNSNRYDFFWLGLECRKHGKKLETLNLFGKNRIK
jgi:hypothetical protein